MGVFRIYHEISQIEPMVSTEMVIIHAYVYISSFAAITSGLTYLVAR
jgi:hypothetical protein